MKIQNLAEAANVADQLARLQQKRRIVQRVRREDGGSADGVNHRRHMRLKVLGKENGRTHATYVPKGKSYPLSGRVLGEQEAARRRNRAY